MSQLYSLVCLLLLVLPCLPSGRLRDPTTTAKHASTTRLFGTGVRHFVLHSLVMCTGGGRHLQGLLDSLAHLGDLEVLGHPTEKTHETT